MLPYGTTSVSFPDACFEALLSCPVCDFECVHLVACTVEQEKTSVHVTHDRLTQQAIPPSGRRGSTVKVEAYCEEGHRFVLCMAFHKGSVFVWHARLPDCPGNESEGYTPPEELWRN